MEEPESFPCIGKYRCKVINRDGVNTLCVYTGGQEEAIYLPIYDLLATIQRGTIQPETLDTPTRPTSHRCGVIRVDDESMHEFLPEISIEDCDTNRQLRARGAFALIKERLLLPESYTVRCMWAEHVGYTWAILVESPELPDMPVGNGLEYPEIEGIYCRDENGPHLVELKVRSQQIVPVKGGYDYLIKSVVKGIKL